MHGARWESSDIDGQAEAEMSGSERVKITEDVRKYAAEQGVTEEEAVKRGLEEKATEFTEAGAEIYPKA